VIERGSLCWVDSAPGGGRRAVVVVQADPFLRSRIPTVLAVPLSWNLRLAEAPGNVLVRAPDSALPRDSVVLVSQLLTLERRHLRETGTRLAEGLRAQVDQGLRVVLGL